MRKPVIVLLLASIITALFAAPGGKTAAMPIPPVAQIVWDNGAPSIEVNGISYAPFMLFISADVDLTPARADLEAELQYADRENVKFVSVNLTFPWRSADTITRAWYFNKIDTWLDFIIDTYPNAYIFPRIWLGPHTPDLLSDPLMDDERILYANTMQADILSLGSTAWKAGMTEALEDGIAHIEANPDFTERVVGYHLAYGDSAEWFQWLHRQYGNDVSPANKAAFRAWLLNKYGSEVQWAAAWNLLAIGPGDPVIPEKPDSAGVPILDPSNHQSYIDFADYTSDIVADSILEAARVVKQETNDERLVMAFHGYSFDLMDGTSGHLALQKLLASEDVDMLAGPYSYLNRGVGGMGAFMSAVDSVTMHGKLWMIEDDTRTYLAESTPFDESIQSRFPTKELTIEGHQRMIGSAIAHRTGLWWMDLSSKGWLNESDLWYNIGTMQQFYSDYMQNAQPLKPDVAFIVDEKSQQFTGYGASVNGALLYNQRLGLYRSGLSFGFYLLEDILAGAVPDARMFVFLNAHYFDENRRDQLELLKTSDRTFVWVYGADIIDPVTLGEVTDFPLSVAAGVNDSSSAAIDPLAAGPWAPIAGHNYPLGVTGVPFYTVSPIGTATVLGTYTASGGKPAVVAQDFGDWKSVFVGTGKLEPELLRSIAQYAGVHTYLASDDVLQTDGTFFSIHASSAGLKTLKLPEPSVVRDAFTGERVGLSTKSVSFPMYAGETRWLVLEPATGGQRFKFDAGFDLDAEGFTYSGYNSTFATSTGVLEVTVTNASLGSGPTLITPANLDIPIGNNGYVNIRLKNTSGASLSKIYWSTDASPGFAESKSATVSIASTMGSYTNYSFDLSSHPNWTGDLTQLRFDLITGSGITNGSKVYVDFVEIAPAPAGHLYRMDASFDLDGEGFTYSGYNSTFSTSSGALEVTVTNASLGSGPTLVTPSALGIQADANPRINIRMKNESGASLSKIYWSTDASPGFAESKSATETIATNMGSYTTYSFDLSSHPNWTGELDQLRFDLITGPGITNGSKVHVAYIEIAP